VVRNSAASDDRARVRARLDARLARLEADEGSGDELTEATIDQAALASIMGDDLAAQMVELSADNEDLYWIASHPEVVGVDGAKAQRKLLKLATV